MDKEVNKLHEFNIAQILVWQQFCGIRCLSFLIFSLLKFKHYGKSSLYPKRISQRDTIISI